MMEENKDTNVKATIDAVTGLVKAIPVYQDTLQPAAKQIGQSLEVVTKTVNIALAPIKALVWGYEKIEDFITTRVSEKLKNVPEENITTPPPYVAGPAVEGLRFAGHDENLRELYANLLATSMDKTTIHKAHPGFVEILKNLSSDEAVLLQAFIDKVQYPLIDVKSLAKAPNTGYATIVVNFSHLHKVVELQRKDLLATYLDNLCRLGILEIPAMTYITAPNAYDDLENDETIEATKKQIELLMQTTIKFDRKLIRTTTFGKQFVANVVKDKE